MISEVTRRDIIDYIIAGGISWSGRLEEQVFLGQLYDLEKLPSKDSRFPTASGDIWQHRVNNPNDWSDDWVFYDDRFNLLRAPDNEFLRFLCETVHPVVRSDPDEVNNLVTEFNRLLLRDGWELFQKEQISGRPVFGAREITHRVEIFEEPTGWPKVDRQISEVRLRIREATNEEQFQAVGLLCRETLISLAQAVYIPERHPSTDGVSPSSTDAKRMLEAYLAAELGPGNKEAIRHAKAALELALALQHKRTADFRTAALCAEATASVVNIIGILSETRVPSIQKTQ
ncbi:MAG: hypothetical protein WBI96_07495 [Candidatus Hydrothermia bacterium]